VLLYTPSTFQKFGVNLSKHRFTLCDSLRSLKENAAHSILKTRCDIKKDLRFHAVKMPDRLLKRQDGINCLFDIIKFFSHPISPTSFAPMSGVRDRNYSFRNILRKK
jgi:hypothetical protein